MKKYGLGFWAVILVCFCSQLVFATDITEELRQYPTCKYCGMDRQKHSLSRMLITYTDGTTAATCSIHCLAVEFAVNLDKTPQSIQVGDYNKLNLIDAEKALWVIGGNMPGVMTKNAKWAFETKSDAEALISRNSGKLATFEDAMKASFEDMYTDTLMIREKRKMMMKKANENKTP
jgi:copper chaperone NosL